MSTFHSKKLLPLLAAFLVFIVSCQKSNNTSQTTSQTAETAQQKAMLMSVTNDVYTSGSIADENYSDAVNNGVMTNGTDGGAQSCRVVTYIPSDSVYPHQTIINFGNGCLGPDGVTRKGEKIVTNYVNPATAAAGTEITSTTFSNYSEDSIAVQGEVKVYVKTTGTPGPLVLQYVDNLTYVATNGSIKSAYGVHYWTQIAGASTVTKSDDVFSITGTSQGAEVLDGATLLTFTATVDNLNPVIKPTACYFRTQGAENVNINLISGGAATFNEHLDYGNGTCDNVATLSIDGGTPQSVTLPLQFWPLSL